MQPHHRCPLPQCEADLRGTRPVTPDRPGMAPHPPSHETPPCQRVHLRAGRTWCCDASNRVVCAPHPSPSSTVRTVTPCPHASRTCDRTCLGLSGATPARNAVLSHLCTRQACSRPRRHPTPRPCPVRMHVRVAALCGTALHTPRSRPNRPASSPALPWAMLALPHPAPHSTGACVHAACPARPGATAQRMQGQGGKGTHTAPPQHTAPHSHRSLMPDCGVHCRQRSYHCECTGSRPITEVKRSRAQIVR